MQKYLNLCGYFTGHGWQDEQAFAKLNAENPMFCEDAASRIRSVLDADPQIADYRIVATHHENLHAHDAVAVASK